MNIFIYSDESGVLDKEHNQYFVFGGVMFLSKEDRDIWTRKYIAAERTVRQIEKKDNQEEVKASNISNKSKSKLYRSLNHVQKFGIVIRQRLLLNSLFHNKKGKQRYLDWAFKMACKSKFEELISEGLVNPSEVEGLYFFVDEHTTATNGLYELQESLEQEFKFGTYNMNWSTFHPPLFTNLKFVKVEYCNSANKTLVRAADIVANHIFYLAKCTNCSIPVDNNLRIIYHP